MRKSEVGSRKSENRILLISVFWFLISVFCAPQARAAGLIRDAEIEHTLRMYADPIFKTAGLAPENIHLFIVEDDSLNAYVAGGQNLFLHTGIIMASENPAMLLGVIAHETGHIAGGHLARGAEQMRNAQVGTILSMVLGAAAGIAGNGRGAMAVITGGQSMVQRTMLSFTRANEQAADESALNTLNRLGISARGMIEMFNLLKRDEMQHYGTIDPYAVTHPLSADRIEYVRAHVEQSGIPDGQYPKTYDLPHQRMRAKLYGFIQLPPKTFARYPQADKSVPARMARAIAWYKIPELDKALAEVNGLIADYPNDPFFHELKGQFLFENGRVADARAAYTKAATLLPDSPLILTSLAETEIASNDYAKAIAHLNKANSLDNTNSHGWRLLATAYGKSGDLGMSALALAEEALLGNDPQGAQRQIASAEKLLKPNTPAALRAEDIKRLATEMKEKKDDE